MSRKVGRKNYSAKTFQKFGDSYPSVVRDEVDDVEGSMNRSEDN